MPYLSAIERASSRTAGLWESMNCYFERRFSRRCVTLW
jgi:hypothetical protein